MARWFSRLEHHPLHQSVACLIPNRDGYREQLIVVSLSHLSLLSLSLSVIKEKNCEIKSIEWSHFFFKIEKLPASRSGRVLCIRRNLSLIITSSAYVSVSWHWRGAESRFVEELESIYLALPCRYSLVRRAQTHWTE